VIRVHLFGDEACNSLWLHSR